MKKEQKEREELQIKEREQRMAADFEKMLDLEIKRKRKETYARWKKGLSQNEIKCNQIHLTSATVEWT